MRAYLLTVTLGILFTTFFNGCENQHFTPAKNTNSNISSIDTALFITKYGKSLVYYAEVDKAGDYYRRMFIDSASAQAVNLRKQLPDRVLFVLETWQGPVQSTVWIRQSFGGEWRSGSFDPTAPDFSLRLDPTNCNGCHSIASLTGSVFTLPLLQKAFDRKKVQVIECDLDGFNPCDLLVYQGN